MDAVNPGAQRSQIIVEFESGDVQAFRVDSLDQYNKSELPAGELWGLLFLLFVDESL